MHSFLSAIFSGELIALKKAFTRVFPSGTHLSAESTEEMRVVSYSRTKHTDATDG